eukprot:Gb_01566 [translate_table: standard]
MCLPTTLKSLFINVSAKCPSGNRSPSHTAHAWSKHKNLSMSSSMRVDGYTEESELFLKPQTETEASRKQVCFFDRSECQDWSQKLVGHTTENSEEHQASCRAVFEMWRRSQCCGCEKPKQDLFHYSLFPHLASYYVHLLWGTPQIIQMRKSDIAFQGLKAVFLVMCDLPHA